MTIDYSDESRTACYVWSSILWIISVSVFCSMVIPDVIESEKWNSQNCNVLNSTTSSYSCCSLTCSNGEASSCYTFLGTCSSNTLFIELNNINTTFTYTCNSDDNYCKEKKYSGSTSCYMRQSDIGTLTVFKPSIIRNAGIIVSSVFFSVAVVCCCFGLSTRS